MASAASLPRLRHRLDLGTPAGSGSGSRATAMFGSLLGQRAAVFARLVAKEPSD